MYKVFHALLKTFIKTNTKTLHLKIKDFSLTEYITQYSVINSNIKFIKSITAPLYISNW